MAKVEQLISRLRAEAVEESHGEFTLDRAKAKLKMRQFQLADPQRYVLMLVQAAILKGAQRIEFAIDADDMRMAFDGQPFDFADLDELYTALFGDRRSKAIHARQELAVALNAAMGLDPRWIRLESGDGTQGVELELRPDREDQIARRAAVPAGTRIHVKDRLRPGLLVRFVRDLGGRNVEEQKLRRQCRWATVQIHLDGELISQVPPLEDAVGRVEWRDEDLGGVVGFSRSPDMHPYMEVLNNGVWLARHELSKLPPGFCAVVDCSALKKDVSQTDVVRDAAYQRLIRAVQRAAEDSIVLACDRWLVDGEAWLRDVLRATLFERARQVERALAANPTITALCDLPLWQGTDGGWVTTARVLKAESAGFCTKATEAIAVPDVLVVRALDDTEQRFWRAVADGRIDDETAAVERELERANNRRAWRARLQPAKLGNGVYLARVSVAYADVQGEIGLRSGGSEKASLRMVLDGRLLYELTPKLPFAGVVAVLEAPLTPNVKFTGAHRDLALQRCVRAFGEGLLQVFTRLAAGCSNHPLTVELRRLFMSWLISVTTRGYRAWLFKQFGFSRLPDERELSRLGAWAYRPAWALDTPTPHAVCELRLFETVDGRVLSLVELARARTEQGTLPWVDREREPIANAPRIVLRLTPREAQVVQSVLGSDALVDFSSEYAKWLAHERFLLQPPEPLAIDDHRVVQRTRFDVPGLTGELGLATHTIEVDGDEVEVPEMGLSADMLHARLIHADRLLCDHWFGMSVPGLVAAVTGDLVVPNAKYTDLEEDAWVGVGRALCSPVADLVGRVAELYATRDIPGWIADTLRMALRACFASPEWVGIYARLRDLLGREAGDEYGRLQALCTRFPSFLVAATITKLEEQGSTPTAAAVSAALAGQGYEEDVRFEPENELRAQLGRHLEELGGVALFPVAGRGESSFGTLLELRARGAVRHVDRSVAARIRYDGPEPILVCNELLRHVLVHLFEEEELVDATHWLEQWENERLLRERQPIEELTLPPASVLARLRLDGAVEGEIGIPRARPLGPARSHVRVCKHRRPVCTVELPSALPLEALLNADDLAIEHADGVGLSVAAADLERIRRVLDDHADALMRVLAECALTRSEAEVARVHVLRYLAPRPDRWAESALASLRTFEDVEGELHCLLDLQAHYRERRVLAYSSGTPVDRPRDRIVVLTRNDELDDLRRLFPELSDYRAEQERERAVAQRKATLVPLPERPPSDALCVRGIDRHGLVGQLWIEAGQDDDVLVGIGGEGLCLGALVLDPLFPCGGAVSGPGVVIDEGWVGYEVDADALAYLRALSLEMYEQLVADGLGSDTESTEPSRQGGVGWLVRALAGPQRGLVRILRHSLIGLQQRRRSGRLAGRERALYRRLVDLPLFELVTGRLICMRIAERERPSELARFELWDALPPESPSDPGDESTPASEVEPVASPLEESTPPPPPEPLPTPPPLPTPEERWLEAVRQELRLVRLADQDLLRDAHLDLLRVDLLGGSVAELVAGCLVINRRHPLVVRAMESGAEDPVLTSLFASIAYTGLNVLLSEISDEHEAAFHRLHAAHVLEGIAARPRSGGK